MSFRDSKSGLNLICVQILAVSLMVSGCKPAAKPRSAEPARKAGAPSRVTPPRPEAERPLEPAPPPEGPDLRPQATVLFRLGSVKTWVGTGLQLVRRAGGPPLPVAKMTRMFMKGLFGELGLLWLEPTLDPGKPMAAALLIPAGAGLMQLFQGRLEPRIVAAVGIRGSGERLLRAMERRAQGKVSTAWGGHAFQWGRSTLWVHIRKGYALFAQQAEHVSSGWKLLLPMLARARPGGVGLELRLGSLADMMSKGLAAFRLMARAAPPSLAGPLKLLDSALRVIRQLGAVSMEGQLDLQNGLVFDIHARGLKGRLAQVVSGMRKPDFALLQVLPGGGFWASIQRGGKTGRALTTDLMDAGWPVGKLWLRQMMQAQSIAALDRLMDSLKGMMRSVGDQAASVAFFHKDGSFHYASVSEIADKAAFRKAYGALGRFLTKDYFALLRSMGAFRYTLGFGKGRYGRPGAARPKTTFRFRKTRLGRYPVDLLQVILPQKKKKQNVGPAELLLGKRFEMATAYVGGKAFTCAGKHWKKYLRTIIRASGKKALPSLSGLEAVLKSKAGSRTASIGGLSLTRFIKGLMKLAAAALPKLARRMGAKRYRGKGKTAGSKVAAKMKQAAKMLSAMVLRWPAGGGLYYRSDGLGGNYRMRLQLDSKEVLALVRAFVMMQKMGKRRGSVGSARKRAKPSSR